MNAAEELIGFLVEKKVRYVFGIEGGSWIPYLELMRKKGIEFIVVANEASAGIMADICFRITGRPGICYATYGPGATNLSTGIGGAFLDRSAVIAFTSETGDKRYGRRAQMNIDHQLIFDGITKWTFRLPGSGIKDILGHAFDFSVSEVPGPVHIGVPDDIGVSEQQDLPGLSKPEIITPGDPDPELLRLCQNMILGSERPLIAAGLTCYRLGLGEKLVRFAERHRIPVMVTPMARGVIPHTHELFAGVLFHAGSDILRKFYRKADLVIGIGYDPVEFCFEDWIPDVPLINIDTVHADTRTDTGLVYDVTGDLGKTLDFLSASEPTGNDWVPAEISGLMASLRASFTDREGVFGTVTVLNILRKVLPEDGVLTVDVGAHTHLAGQMWRWSATGKLIMTNGWSSMGFGIPSAIAAKLFLPKREVACVTGDGGFMMMAGEMVTARRLGLKIIFIVLADGELGLIRVKQDNRGVPRYAVKLYEGDLINERSFLGVPVRTVCSGDELKTALMEAKRIKGPLIIEAVINGSGYGKLITERFR